MTMPVWLTFVCAAAVLLACVYLLYVILRPDRF
jgi:K+-transporting ATPase KdpF subunit